MPVYLPDQLLQRTEKYLYDKESNFHPACKPYITGEVIKCIPDSLPGYDSIVNLMERPAGIFDLAITNPKVGNLYIGPIVDFIPSFGTDSSKAYLESGYGLAMKYNNKLGLTAGAEMIYGVSSFNSFIQGRTESLGVIPGQGWAMKKEKGYVYRNNSFFLAYSPSKYIRLEVGNGKHFWGDGHRSMLLSYNAYNYPYLKTVVNVWNIKYTTIIANFKDIRFPHGNTWKDFENKYGTFHLLSWNLTKWLNVGLFEAIIWQDGDSLNEKRGIDVNYMNPVIFYRPVEFSLGSPDNALLGMTIQAKLPGKIVLYEQIVLDDFIKDELLADVKHAVGAGDSLQNYGYWTNKIAIQSGLKAFDLFRVAGLDLQLEFNMARPYTYSHRWIKQNYGHFNEPLAHPLGANFMETIGRLSYTHNKFYIELKMIRAVTGLDSNGTHFGQNIYLSTYDTPEGDNIPVQQYGNTIGQGVSTSFLYNSLKVSYLINSESDFRIEAGVVNRVRKSEIEKTSCIFIFMGIRTSIPRHCYDY